MNTLLADPNSIDRVRIGQQLIEAGHEVTTVGDGASVITAIKRYSYSLVVTEWLLGDMTALELVQAIKSSSQNSCIPILMLSDEVDSSIIVKALDGGIDDCLAKSCQTEELVARASAVLRRSSALPEERALKVGPVTLDRTSHKVLVGINELTMSPLEYRLLNFFMENQGRMFGRQQLLEEVWKRRNGISSRTVDVHVRRLRATLEPHYCDHLLQTVHGFGYRFG